MKVKVASRYSKFLEELEKRRMVMFRPERLGDMRQLRLIERNISLAFGGKFLLIYDKKHKRAVFIRKGITIKRTKRRNKHSFFDVK